MASLPKVLDVRDDLRRAEEATEADIHDETEEVLALLAEYAGDNPADSANLDEAEETLLRLQERTDDDVATERFQAARNRIGIFRDSISGEDDGLVVLHTERTGDDAIRSTVVNSAADPATGTVTVTFYDGDGTELGSDAADASFDADEEKPVTVSTDVPDGVDRFVSEAERTGSPDE